MVRAEGSATLSPNAACAEDARGNEDISYILDLAKCYLELPQAN